MLDGVKAVAKAYGAVSGAVKVVRHPIQAVQDAIRDFVVKTLVRVLVQIVGEAAIAQIVTSFARKAPSFPRRGGPGGPRAGRMSTRCGLKSRLTSR